MMPSTCVNARWRVGVCRAMCQMLHTVQPEYAEGEQRGESQDHVVTHTVMPLRPAAFSRGRPAASAAAPPLAPS